MKLYKVISKDHQSQSGGSFDWSDYLPIDGEPGKWTPEVEVSPCNSGYHVTPCPCMWMEDGSLVYEVECKGDGKGQSDVGTIDKIAFPSIRLTKLADDQSFDGNMNSGNGNSGDRNSGHMNSGNGNSGDRNSGNWNSGNWNSGNMNSGHRNSGHRNSGNWNSCDGESGFLNSEQPVTVRVFNKPCEKSEWMAADKPQLLFFELGSKTYEEAFQASWDAASEEDQAKLFRLPNFDAQVFFAISGIDLRNDPRSEVKQ
ncbi:MAG: pentapeptide repeat-containing protein [Planctomycetota bacterium]